MGGVAARDCWCPTFVYCELASWSVTAVLAAVLGVSCDACGKSNFPGKRYKCLICYDFDLCSDCYDGGQEGGGSGPHEVSHPMQCILTRVDAGEGRNTICNM